MRSVHIRRAVCLAVLGAAFALVGTVAWAYWSQSGAGSGTGAGATFNPPGSLSATNTRYSSSVSVSWSAAKTSANVNATGYYVTRVNQSDNSTAPACGTSAAAPVTTLSCTDSSVANGTYRYVVTAMLKQWTALSASSASVSVVSSPTVSASVSPTPNGNGFNNTSPVTVTLTASASAGFSSITYQLDSASAVTVTSNPATVSVTGDGTHSLVYSAKDVYGTSSGNNTQQVKIDTAAPATPGAPALTTASDTGASSTDRITNDNTPTVTGTAESGATVVIYDGSSVVGTGTATSSGYSITTNTLADGSHTLTAVATDPAGNSSASSSGTAVTIDTTAPTLTVNQASGQADPTTGTTINFTATASESVVAFTGTAVTLGGTAGATTTTVSGSASPWTLAVTGMVKTGTVTATIAAGKITDIAGNTNTAAAASTDNSVQYNDTTAPATPAAPTLDASSDTGTSNSDKITNDTTPTFTGTAEAGSTVKLLEGSTVLGTVTATGGSYTVTSSTLASGTHSITVTATDPSGNVSATSSATSITIDTTAPTVTMARGSNQAASTSTTPITFTATFSETVAGFTTSDVTLGGTAGATTVAISGTNPAYTLTVSGMVKSGTVTATVPASVVTDTAGNNNTAASAAASVTYTDSTAPTVSISSMSASGRVVTVSGTGGTTPGDNLSVTVVLCTTNATSCPSGNVKATLTASVNASTGAWSTSTTLNGAATLYARATQTDQQGNTGASAVNGPTNVS